MKKLSLLTIILALFAFNNGSNAQAEVEFILQWDVAPTANTPQYRAEYYSVWISTDGTNPENFEMVWDETLSTTEPNWEYQAREVDITNFGGEIIHVAFRHHDITDMDRIVIDNVKITMRDVARNGMEEVLLMEDFQEGVGDEIDEEWLPEGWTKVDADGDDFNWYFQVREGEGAMRSQSWDSEAGALTPDNWLFTPAVHLAYVGINQVGAVSYSMFPNPANTYVNLQAGSTINQLVVMDMLGKVLINETINMNNVRISTIDLEAGLYLLRIHTEQGVVDTKLQVVR
jgi:hypothetical protein